MPDLNQPEDLAPPGPSEAGELSAMDRIAMEAQADEAERAAEENKFINGEPETEPVIDPARAWGTMAMTVGGFLGMAMPELRAVYTEDACMQWGTGMAAVADKYGWDAGDTVAKWAPECALLMASIPLIVPTVVAVKERRAAAKAKQLNPVPRQGGAEGVAGSNNAPTEPINPMMQEPGGFSVPT